MEIYISNSSGVPIYAQITDQIRAKILTGELKEGEMLRHLQDAIEAARLGGIAPEEIRETLNVLLEGE